MGRATAGEIADGLDDLSLESDEYLQALVAGHPGVTRKRRHRRRGSSKLRSRRRGKKPGTTKSFKRATALDVLDDPFSYRGFRPHRYRHRHKGAGGGAPPRGKKSKRKTGKSRRADKKKRKGSDGQPDGGHEKGRKGKGKGTAANGHVESSTPNASGPLASIDPAKKAKSNEIANLIVQMAIQMALSPDCQECGIDVLEKALLGPFAPFSSVLSPRNARLARGAINLFRSGGAGVLLNAGKDLIKLAPVKAIANTATMVGGKVDKGGQVAVQSVQENGKKEAQTVANGATQTAANAGNTVKKLFNFG